MQGFGELVWSAAAHVGPWSGPPRLVWRTPAPQIGHKLCEIR